MNKSKKARELKPARELPMERRKSLSQPMTLWGGPPPDPPMPINSSSDAIARCQLCAARRSCLVGQLPRSQQERLDPLILETSFRKGASLQDEANSPSTVRVVKLGTVMITRRGPDNEARPIAMVGRGHMLGMLCLVNTPTETGATALSSGRLCELPVSVLGELIAKDGTARQLAQQRLASDMALLADWGHVMRLRGLPRQLVATLILLAREQGNPSVLLPSQIALAALLSTTRESVARTLRQLDDIGHLIRSDRWHAELTGTHRRVFSAGD
ncbi:MAG: Crp/Fnr family transcriptional regulator [Hydrogenophaga sp.]|nr:Crp/Fnr family transcriptional regulator [Hydrogenophaga sp.]